MSFISCGKRLRWQKNSKSKTGKTPIYVGAVITKAGKYFTGYRGEDEIGVHAEVTALQKVPRDFDLKEATIYTTLEPCIVGSHPGEKYRWPCAKWIVEKEIKRVWIAELDPNQNICGRGYDYLKDNGKEVRVDVPSQLLQEFEELKELNKEFLEKQKRVPTVLLANRSEEKSMMWRFLARLQFQENRYYGSRLLWYYGPPGIGKSELIAWLRVAAIERNIIKGFAPIILSSNKAIIYFQQLANVKNEDIETIRREGGYPEDFVCTALANNLQADTEPKFLIIDSDFSFDDLEGLSDLVERTLYKLQHAPYLGIVVATRKPPYNIRAYPIASLSLNDVEEICKLKRWQIEERVVQELHKKSKGNPLQVILLYACYVASGRIPGSTNMRDILQDFLSHVNPMGRELLKKLSVSLSAPFEEVEKIMAKSTLLASVPTEERSSFEAVLNDLGEMGIIQIKDANLWMHDEIIEQFEKLLPDGAIQQHYELAQTLKTKDPLGALWHLMKSKKVDEAIHLLETAESWEEHQILRFIAIFSAVAQWLKRLSRQEVRKRVRAKYHFHMGNIFNRIGTFRDIAENSSYAIKAYVEALKVYTLKRFPMQYATIQNNLGGAYKSLAEVENRPQNSNKAIEAFLEALKVYTLKRFPMQYAGVQNNLGYAYTWLAEVEDKAENSKKAIQALKEALKTRTREHLPTEYATTQNHLGAAYRTLAEVEGTAENSKKAIQAHKEALKVWTLKRFPMQYAWAQNNLGGAYTRLAVVEDKAENSRKAIQAHKEALKVTSLERFPIQYANATYNLGLAYGLLAQVEDKAENCERAIQLLEEALKVLTKERFPQMHQEVEGWLIELKAASINK